MALFIGVLSGTSIDGIDIVLCDIDDQGKTTTLSAETFPFSPELRQLLSSLCHVEAGDINLMMLADVLFAEACADACLSLLSTNKVSSASISAIGFHGQTIRHFPQGLAQHQPRRGFTLQIGDAQRLACLTGIAVVSDFRRKDVALGGQGAPLVPAFHLSSFASEKEARAIVNLGGIANVTWLPNKDPQRVLGCDTGPANGLLDAWVMQCQGATYDVNGSFAQAGRVDTPLLTAMLQDPYFAMPAPKSTGREYFNLGWLMQFARVLHIAPADVQATLMALTVQTIVDAIDALGTPDTLYLCGGGCHNRYLCQQLASAVPYQVADTLRLGIAPDWVEGAAFAWLAWAHERGVTGNIVAVTGARRAAVLGQRCLPD